MHMEYLFSVYPHEYVEHAAGRSVEVGVDALTFTQKPCGGAVLAVRFLPLQQTLQPLQPLPQTLPTMVLPACFAENPACLSALRLAGGQGGARASTIST